MYALSRLAAVVVLSSSLIGVFETQSTAKTKTKVRALNSTEVRVAQRRLVEMGYPAGAMGLTTFQKWEGRKVTGRLTRGDYDAILSAEAPQPKDTNYEHVEVDLDRQVLLLIGEDGAITKILPVSTGSGRRYNEKGMRGLAYTPRGRFKVYNKLSGWKRSPLGLLYYPNYFSDGLAIHGNPSVPKSPQSHGCIRVPMSAAADLSRHIRIGTIILIYDKDSFVSAKDWANTQN
jgi:lipoprotein-anchoring transpeptidase ErfK/SrfK